MTIQELGSLGEFISSIAVLITLVYLAVQVRAASRAQISGALDEGVRSYSEWRRIVLENPSIRETILKARSDIDCLTDEELFTYDLLQQDYYWRLHADYMRCMRAKDGQRLKQLLQSAAMLVEGPRFSDCWLICENTSAPEFVAEINQLMKVQPSA